MQPDNSSGETNPQQTNQPNIPPEPSSVQEQPPENTNTPVKKKGSKKIFIILAAIFVVLLLAIISFLIWQNYQNKQAINDYQSCATASGSVIQESYPEKCVTKSGQVFVRELSKEEKQKLSPTPEGCEPCPVYDLLPDFCLDGEVVFGEKDECGCPGPPKCVR